MGTVCEHFNLSGKEQCANYVVEVGCSMRKAHSICMYELEITRKNNLQCQWYEPTTGVFNNHENIEKRNEDEQ